MECLSRLLPISPPDDVTTGLASVAVGTPVNRTVELAGPEPLPLDELVRRFSGATDDSRPVIADTRVISAKLQFEIGGPYGKVV